MQRLNLSPAIIITVIIPVYNVEKYLQAAIDSVLSQNVNEMEVIAINDGSTDSSKEILENYAAKDKRLNVIHQENRGLSAVRNRGLKLAKGKYIYFFDSDDILGKNALGKVLKRLESTKSEMACFSINLIDESGSLRTARNERVAKAMEIAEPVTGENFLKKTFTEKKYGAIVQKYVFLKSFLVEHQLRFDEGYIHEDEAFTMEALCLASRVVSFQDVLILKRTRPGSIMNNQRSEKNVKGWLKAASRLLQFSDTVPVSEETETIIRKKASQLILISLQTIQKINRGSGTPLSLYDYIDKDKVRSLGAGFYLKVKFNLAYKAYNKVKELFML